MGLISRAYLRDVSKGAFYRGLITGLGLITKMSADGRVDVARPQVEQRIRTGQFTSAEMKASQNQNGIPKSK